MAKKSNKNTDLVPTSEWTKWSLRIAKAEAEYKDFCQQGKTVIDRYRLEASRNSNMKFYKDKYNILYSSTETMRPSLYAQTPKPQVNPRHKDNTNQDINLATVLLENCLEYGMQDINMDSVMENVIGDYLLPGLGMAWVNYDVQTQSVDLNEGKSDENPDIYEYTEWERLNLEYVHFKDILFSGGRVWEDIWWIAKRAYVFKEDAEKRFGAANAAKLDYSHSQDDVTSSSGKNHARADSTQAIVWEIWDKRSKQVLWWSDGTKDILDKKDDPLKLEGFFPCPKPLRAVTTTDSFCPRAFFTQYQQQAETLDDLTMRIRILSDALKLVGVYDQSQAALSRLLTGNQNKMVAIENWAQFASQGSMQGAVQFLPIKEVALVLTELYKQREICKNEIYEITGFSDIVRGVSKASETLGAQEIKNQWAGGRLRMLQKDVQRFCRDIIRIMAEIIAEHFDDDTIKQYSGFNPPPLSPQEQEMQKQATMQALQTGVPPELPPTEQQLYEQQFDKVLKLLRAQRSRCAAVDIETDSTIQPDEAEERKDRMDFLGAMGAFLQQAGPMAMQYPDMRGLLGAMMMFTARTFRASRPIEKEFDDFQKSFANAPAQDPNKKEGDGGAGAVQTAQIKAQSDQAKIQADSQVSQAELASRERIEMAKIQAQQSIKDRELAVREREVAVKEKQLGLNVEAERHDQRMDEVKADQADDQLEAQERQSERQAAAQERAEKSQSED